MVYEVYAGGIHAVQAVLETDFSKPGRYDVVLRARTQGFLASLVPWTGSFESAGWLLAEGDYRPQTHKSTASWQGDLDQKEYSYSKDRAFLGLTVSEHGKPPHKEAVDDSLTQGTTDILAAALQAMHGVGKGGECAGESEVFDGKRRFLLVFKPQGHEMLKASSYNAYEGPAALCSVEVVPVAGEWHKKPRGWLSIQEQGRSRGMMPMIWVAQVVEAAPPLPVKIRVKTAYGTLFMHLISKSSQSPAKEKTQKK
ncbi:MAG: DUF3108 domain-containing protein [Alphaproteobacteria bacterium]|nr:DUF3108 domain-containing protein [Alphaproteobacteria bacterium]